MAAYISFQPNDFFSPTLYTGNGSTQSITGVGFQPDFVWGKQRTDSGANFFMFDAPRGVTNIIESSSTAATNTDVNSLTAFGADGFTLGTDAQVNENLKTMVSWNWKAGTTTGLTGGTITPSAYSINTTSGFGVYAYTGTGATATIAHGLGVAPRFMMFKELGGTAAWMVYQEDLGNGSALILNTNATKQNGSTYFNDTSPTSSVFTVGSNGQVNGSTQTYIAYVFANVKGYSKFSTYTGNGNADGPFVYTGFRPAFVMTKRYDSTSSWDITDSKRGYNNSNFFLRTNGTYAEDTDGEQTLLSNGFKPETTNADSNASGGTYIYVAFAESPIVSSNDVPTVAR